MIGFDSSTRILVVDGNSVMRRLLAVSIINKGYQVTTAGRASEARSFMRDREYDVVVTDVDLDGMDGYELIRSFKSEDRDLKVLVMGKGAFNEMPALLHGALDAIVKPFSNTEFMLKLEMVLGEKRTSVRFRSRDLFCRITGADGPVEGVLNNVSFGGALIDTERSPAGTDDVDIEFIAPVTGDVIGSARAHVIRRLDDAGRFRYQLAVLFRPDGAQARLMDGLLPYIEGKV